MRVQIDVRIDSQGQQGYGNLSFQESADFQDAGFDTVSKIFTKCHELLETLKLQHMIRIEEKSRK